MLEAEGAASRASSSADTGSRSSGPLIPVSDGAIASPVAQGQGALFSDGETVAGRYRLVRFIARGGMGEVFEVEDLEVRSRSLSRPSATTAGAGMPNRSIAFGSRRPCGSAGAAIPDWRPRAWVSWPRCWPRRETGAAPGKRGKKPLPCKSRLANSENDSRARPALHAPSDRREIVPLALGISSESREPRRLDRVRGLQEPHALAVNDPGVHEERVARSYAELVAELQGKGSLPLRGQSDPGHHHLSLLA